MFDDGLEVSEEEDGDDWMLTLLKSPIFKMLPPVNLQKILMMPEVRFNAGEVIIKQGDQGDYFYIIKKGQCLISRKPAPNANDIKLGKLTDLEAFGEDALISGQPRNVTITAATDVSLMRLGKEQFLGLIKTPTLKYINYAEAENLLPYNAELIDVREPGEFAKHHLPHSSNVPFFSLRMQLKTINRQHPVIVVCKDGKTSETAAFILLAHNFDALVLRGGMDSLVAHSNVAEDKALAEPPKSEALAPAETQDVQQLLQTIENLKIRCRELETEKNALELKCRDLVGRAG